MKIKFNLYERVAGLFVLTAIFGGVAASFGIAIKKGWFEARMPFETTLTNADGVHIGTQVQMAGIRAGSVTAVELRSTEQIVVKFEVSEKFFDRMREDSVVRVVRPFIIGEKVLDVSIGGDGHPRLAEHAHLKSEPTADIMDLVSGRTLGPYIETMGQMGANLKFVAEALLDPERTKEMVKIFDQLSPLLKNANTLTRHANVLLSDISADKKLVHALDNLITMTDEVNTVLPALVKDSPQLASDLSKIAKNMAVLTDEMQKALPALQQSLAAIGPELPHASRRALEALDETVVTLKALQKSFILRGSVKDVRDEEAGREKTRVPASDDTKE